ncbi:MAG TPA: Shedu anti-phage system protein SduA domain-containing protein, partial [Nitrospira sp.]
LKADIRNYRQNVLNELDNLGFIVTYEAGRYRLGPALKPRPDLVGYYYFGPADMRPDRFVTVDRDLVGVQLEVELLEALLNKKDTSEGDFQKFFAEYPHFLSTLAIPMPHVQLRDETGKLLVPDFILKPIVATQRDSRWEVLDLKKPQASLIVGKGSRRRLSHNVQEAIRQLRDYGDYFADPRNGGTVERALGHRLRRPKLGVLIGRMVASELEALEIEQNRLPDVRIITYDEILDQQRALGS